MAEVYDDPDTGESFIKTATGDFVSAVKSTPEALAGGIISGALDNMLIAKGATDVIGAGLDVVGLDDAAGFVRRTSGHIAEARGRIEPDISRAAAAERPGTFLAGQVGGSFLPGSARIQGAIGALQGIGLGDTPGEQMFGAAAGGLGGLGGGKGTGHLTGRLSRVRQLRGDPSAKARANAAGNLERLGVPLRESDLAPASARGAKQRDRLRQLLSPDDAVRVKRDALNEVITDTILPGRNSNAVTSGWMSDLADEVDVRYQSVRDMLPAQNTIDDVGDAAGLRMVAIAEDARADMAPVLRRRVDSIIGDYDKNRLTPERWNQHRSSLAADARSLHRNGEWETAQGMYGLRDELDQMVHGGDPDTIKALGEASELFRYSEVMQAPNVINKELDINPGAFMRNIKSMFPGVWRRGNQNPQGAQVMFEAMSAAEQFPQFRSSGTGEMMTSSSLMRQLSAAGQLAVGSLPEMIGGTAGRVAGNRLNDIEISDIPGLGAMNEADTPDTD